MPTMKEMCEAIEKAKILTKPDGTFPTALEIYNSSPTGEIWQIVEWYELVINREKK